ncbi:hypothetical protein CspeluHIS016_0303540 [Cutaneotrichosporon spelunceum]|uniref:WD40 repeat-like protein n=1 Tax=Cutaneotrichosporon spelunceum TaxID=1672016 RepID=A0AAD3YC65_9TREE|nr:hypothetical protein CspeluHIS016_0303540 [Cutaneotrichosporon spelunceum]
MQVKSLSYIDIQHDALAVFDDVEQGIVLREDVWVSAYQVGQPSVHGKMRVSLDGGVSIECREGVQVGRESKANLRISVPALQIASRPVHFPRQTLVPPYTKASAVSPELSINALDYSARARKLVVAGPDGYVVILDPATSDALQLQGHVGDVLDAKWFPSGEVVLTASADMSLRIFSAVTGINPRVLRGHSRAITATHILGVGRQVLSAGKDGSVRLWNVGAGTEERAWRLKLPVDALAVVEGEQAATLGAGGADGAVVAIAATADGSLTGFALGAESEEPLFTTPPTDSKLVCAAYSPTLGVVATGHADGNIALRRLSDLSEPAAVVRRNEASVYSLAFDRSSLLVGTASGLPARLAISDTLDIEVAEEYAGWEAVGVEAWAVGDGVWCGGADGVLRRY